MVSTALRGALLCLLGCGMVGPAVAASSSDTTAASSSCVNFVGDVSLSRGVAQALASTHRSPFTELPRTNGDAWIGNLEGAVHSDARTDAHANCRNPAGICLPIAPDDLGQLRGVFSALSLANNHSDDYGSRAATAASLRALGITPLVEEEAPQIVQLGGQTWALVPIDLTSGTAEDREQALLRARLQIGLGRAHTPRVVVMPHWGREYSLHPDPLQEKLAARLHAWGALLVIGSHSHVVQDQRCSGSTATYYGLGNHLFDGPRTTWQGLLVRCCAASGSLDCTPLATHRTADLVFPRVDGAMAGERCQLSVPPPQPADQSWQRHPAKDRFVYVQPYRSLGVGHYFALHRSYSSFDQEVALRPQVFRVEHGRSLDLWRGTALSRPLLAARLITVGDHEYLCAIHRGDSFLKRDPKTTKRYHTLYEWSGFGFHGVIDDVALQRCREL